MMNILEEIQNCPVEWKELGEVTDTVTSPVKLTKKEYQVSGKIPIVDQGEQFIAGFSDYGKYLKKDEYIIFGDHSEHVKYIDFAFVQGADGLKILKPKSGIKAKYIYYCFCNFYKKEGSYKRHWSKARTTLIPIPQSEEIQEKIVQTLDKFTDYVTELTSELTSRKKQYSFYRDKLLSFEDEVYQVDWKTLGEVATVTKLAGYEFTKYVNYSSTGEIIALRALNVKKGRLVLDDVKYIDNSEFSKLNRSKLQIDDMLFTYVGTVGEVALIDKDDTYYLAPNVAMVRLNTNTIIAKYLMYYCQSNGFVYNQIERLMEASSMKNLTMEKIRKFKIPVPSLEIQSRIVQVLDNFDTVCNDLNIGLPKEIELRQKQYEYFRDKLLTFVAEGEYTDSTVQYRQDIIRLLNWVFGPIQVKLGQVINLQRGKRLVRNQLTTSGSFPVYQNSLTPLGYFTHSNRSKGTSFIICAGAAGEIGYSDTDFWAADDVYTLETSDNISDKFMYYVLISKQDRLKSQVRKASIPRLSKDAIDKVAFYLPSLAEQERIVSILDNFNTLTNSLSEGLPKEIELRQKQYEYWREQLLNFTR
jgi:putative type I restriction-modification system, specificity determinant